MPASKLGFTANRGPTRTIPCRNMNMELCCPDTDRGGEIGDLHFLRSKAPQQRQSPPLALDKAPDILHNTCRIRHVPQTPVRPSLKSVSPACRPPRPRNTLRCPRPPAAQPRAPALRPH